MCNLIGCKQLDNTIIFSCYHANSNEQPVSLWCNINLKIIDMTITLSYIFNISDLLFRSAVRRDVGRYLISYQCFPNLIYFVVKLCIFKWYYRCIHTLSLTEINCFTTTTSANNRTLVTELNKHRAALITDARSLIETSKTASHSFSMEAPEEKQKYKHLLNI